MLNRPAHALLAFLALLLGPAVPAQGRDCGGRQLCRCGDQVTKDYVLPADLGPCDKNGLVVREGAIVDGQGHVIRGRRAPSSAGIVLDEKSGAAIVRNLVVTGFERGVRLAGARKTRVDRVESHHNGDPVAHKGYGIDLARGASENLIENVYVHHNADEGIHVGRSARKNRILASRFEENHRENVYFLENEDNSLETSTLVGGGASSVFVKHARDVRIEGNRIVGRGIQIRGDSRNVLLRDNQLSAGGVVLQPYADEARGRTSPRGVILSGGRVQSEDACVRVIEARAVRVESVALDCRRSFEIGGGSDVSAVDVALRRVVCRGPGVLRRSREIEVRFVDADGEPVSGVRLRDGGGVDVGVSGEDGRVRGPVLLETLRCPGPTRIEAGAAEIERAPGEARPVAVEALAGDLRIDG